MTSHIGRGTTFRFTIPTGGHHEASAFASETASVAADEVSTPGYACRPLEGSRILLADDCLDNQRLFSRALEKTDAEVVVVENGQVAVQEALAAEGDSRPFGVILMDMQMPVLDGYDATRRLRDAGYRLPIIALTAHAMTDARDKLLTAGCDAIVTKPVNLSDLMTTVRKSLPRTTTNSIANA